MLEDGTYPGLDEAIDEFGAEPPEPQEPSPDDIQQHLGMLQSPTGPLSRQRVTEVYEVTSAGYTVDYFSKHVVELP